jgi:hypothetical protein
MIPYFYYLSAKRRLYESELTIEAMGGEEECQDMIVAQRDMLILEMDYYRIQSKKFTIKLLLVTTVCVILYILNNYGVIHV